MSALPPSTEPRFHRYWIPALALGLPASLFAMRAAFVKYEILPESWFYLQSFAPMALMLGLGVIALWFFFLSRFSSKLRLTGLALLLATGVAAGVSIRGVEFDGNMTPRLFFRWEQTHAERLAEHRSKTGQSVAVADLTAGPTDSPYFRGWNGDGITTGLSLAGSWEGQAPKVRWKHPLDDGLAGIAVAGDSLITLEQRGELETVLCYSRQTGLQRWEQGVAAKFTQTAPMGGSGPRTTPAIHQGRVYTLGAAGDLLCLEGVTGKKLWHVNVLADNNAKNVEWGLSGSPLIVGDLVVVAAGTAGAVAYDLNGPTKRWGGKGTAVAYASPLKMGFEGREAVVVFDSQQLQAIEAKSGEVLWSIPWQSPMNMNSAQPLIIGRHSLLVSSELSNGSAAYEFKRVDGQWKAEQLWKTRALAARFASPVIENGYVYGLSEGKLVCLDASNGKLKWKEGDFGNGQVLLADGKLIVVAEKKTVALVAADPNDFRELGTISILTDRTWNMPALAGKELFIRNHREMACIELP